MNPTVARNDLLKPSDEKEDSTGGRNSFTILGMADSPRPHFSEQEAKRAGTVLSGQILWTPETSEEAAQIFRIAYDWRNSHAFPMQRVRYELAGRIRRLKADAITAARTKRMRSIRKKLSRTTLPLNKIQDLGGCRAIVRSIEEMNSLVNAYQNGASVHQIIRSTDYISAPKIGGYRSHHFVLSFQGTEDELIYDGRRIEVQVRTRLQHVWATAVEAMGLIRNEDMKAGEGDKDWLRLFALMSSEFSEIEKSPIVPGTSDRLIRAEEIKHLEYKLQALATLRQLNAAFKTTEQLGPKEAKYFLIQYDGENHTIKIRGFSNSLIGAERFSNSELADSRFRDSVLVEVDKVENLREAYPNYYLDVGQFAERLGVATNLTPLAHAIKHSRDLSWLTKYQKPRL